MQKFTTNELNVPGFRVTEPLSEEPKSEKSEFKKWLDFLFIKTHYRIRDPLESEIAMLSDQTMIIRKGFVKTKIDLERKIKESEEELKRLYDEGTIYIDRYDWSNKEIRAKVIRKIIEFSNIKPAELNKTHFESLGLMGLFSKYKQSAFSALVDADLAYDIETIKIHSNLKLFGSDKLYFWQMEGNTKAWSDKDLCIAAIRWFYEERRKKTDALITQKDFTDYGLEGMFSGRYSRSPYMALLEAGYVFSQKEISEQTLDGNFSSDKLYPWELGNAPNNYWQEKPNRIAAIKWMFWKMEQQGIDPKEINYQTLVEYHLSGLIDTQYNRNLVSALIDSGLVYSAQEIESQSEKQIFESKKYYPWELKVVQQFYWEKSENRIAACRWLNCKINNKKRIEFEDFKKEGLGGLIGFHGCSPYKALLEAGVIYSDLEIINQARERKFELNKLYPWDLMHVPSDYWSKENNRIAAIRWLEFIKPNPSRADFERELGGLFNAYYSCSVKSALENSKLDI